MKADVLIAGIGSAGFAAAYGLLTACPGIRAVLVDPNPGPGGTSVFGGVCCWEPGRSGYGVHEKLARRLLDSGEGFVGKTTEFLSSENRWAVSSKCLDPYESTLRRSGVTPEEMRRFHFSPSGMSRVMNELLAQAARGSECRPYYRSFLLTEEIRGRSVFRAVIRTPEGDLTIEPTLVIDCTGGAVAASLAGEPMSVGEEPFSAYGEPSAPAEATRSMNGVTQCFRILPGDGAEAGAELPEGYRGVDLTDWEEHMRRTDGPVACWNEDPDGGFIVNMLPTAPGDLLTETEPHALKRICEARVHSYWRWLTDRCPAARRYHIDSLFPQLGLRENRRLIGEYVLREQDLLGGIPSCGAESIVAIADHPADIHGSKGRLTATGVYGIPYGCLLPRKTDNLLVAGMSASFSHIAASSARLSRTMLELGEAAGAAAAVCLRQGIGPKDVPVRLIREAVQADRMTDEINRYAKKDGQQPV